MPRVAYLSRGLSGRCIRGESVLEAVRSMGYVIDHACGGNARCGTCCVRVLEGELNLSPVGAEEAAMLRELGLGSPHRLSCQAKVLGDVVVVSAA
ncbi:MAG TPA: 2Fe-2S iron-sulfur cluster-binding protein [Candidatus Saccharimonadales bacterium]|nr:2Fe-2S iron-sulfur cluster-binding protein [Candidatus Saccharimonadales bacterium]